MEAHRRKRQAEVDQGVRAGLPAHQGGVLVVDRFRLFVLVPCPRPAPQVEQHVPGGDVRVALLELQFDREAERPVDQPIGEGQRLLHSVKHSLNFSG